MRNNTLVLSLFLPILQMVWSVDAKESDSPINPDNQTYEVLINNLKEKIRFMQEEIDYLHDHYTTDDKRWVNYKQEADNTFKLCEEVINKTEMDSISKENLISLGQELEKLHAKIPLKLPSGPQGPGAFGAYYTYLKYSLTWDKPWRVGSHADIVVRFDEFDYKFIFWRGASYVPCWVTENDIWYCNEFCETEDGTTQGSCEPISDKQTRYTHVRIIENNDARVVVHWRYALTDVNYRLAHLDPNTGWNDWADEYYTIYPDGIGVRKIILWSSRLDMWLEFQEAIVINQPGTRPDDAIDLGAVTIANLQGESKTYFWTEEGTPGFQDKPLNSCIERINLKAAHQPFIIVPPEVASITSFGGSAPGSHFNCWDHWPVSQDASLCRVVENFDRPSHSSLSWVVTPRDPANMGWKDYEITNQSITKLLLHGMTDKSMMELAQLGRSWLQAPCPKLIGEGFISNGFDPSEKAYMFSRRKDNPSSPLKFTIEATMDSPLYNPAFLVKNWGDKDFTCKLNGNLIEKGKEVRASLNKQLDGIDLIVWLKYGSTKAVEFEIGSKN